MIGNSLILMGEIGGNDYNHALIAGKSIDEVKTYVPLVIEAIVSTVNVRTFIKGYVLLFQLTGVY